MLKPKKWIDNVDFYTKAIPGKCCRCGQEGLVINVMANIQYKEPNTLLKVETQYNIQYCGYCLSQMLNPDESLDGMYE